MMCPGCFTEKGVPSVCPHCGHDAREEPGPLVLPPGTQLARQYVVGRVLGEPGGFGITYLAWDQRLHTRVALKEFMPRELVVRAANRKTVVPGLPEHADLFYLGLTGFLQEARTLARFDHPNIVRVRTYFEENGTGYLVMHYYDGVGLDRLLAQRGGRVAEPTAVEIMTPVLEGLRAVHRHKFLHRDVKPSNIYLVGGSKPILLDFGAARLAIGERSRNLTVILTPGFAPYEQYFSDGRQGPWTDLYACGATLYYLVSGIVPPLALDRASHDRMAPIGRLVPGLSASFCDAVSQALAVRPEQRPQDVDRLLALLRSKRPERGDRREDTPASQVVHCPHCRSRNRVPAGTALQEVRCGRCGGRLASEGRPGPELAEVVRCPHCGAKNRVRLEPAPASPTPETVRCGRCSRPLPFG